MKFNVACVQISSQNDIKENISKAARLIKDAANNGADLVTLPENIVFMGTNGDELLDNSYHMDDHPALKEFKKIARKLKIWLLIGSLAVKVEHSHKIANRSIFIDDEGELAAHYDKIHLYNASIAGGETHQESDRYIAGNKATIVDTPWGKIGMTICYDLRFPHLYRTIAKNGAHIITVPSAFTQFTGEAHWYVLLRARAIENASYIIAPAQTGSHPANRRTFGHSLIIDPWGRILADGGDSEGIIMAEIDADLTNKIRKQLPSLEHDRDFDF